MRSVTGGMCLLRKNVRWVKLHQHNQTYPQLNSYRDNEINSEDTELLQICWLPNTWNEDEFVISASLTPVVNI